MTRLLLLERFVESEREREREESAFLANAILSHAWELDDVLFPGMQGYDWIWIDNCCIDKSGSAELSEAVNSMFRRYSYALVLLRVPGRCRGGEAAVHDP